jgi:hypothetical protein
LEPGTSLNSKPETYQSNDKNKARTLKAALGKLALDMIPVIAGILIIHQQSARKATGSETLRIYARVLGG